MQKLDTRAFPVTSQFRTICFLSPALENETQEVGIETRFKEERDKGEPGNLIQCGSWGKGVWISKADYHKMRAEASLFFF